MEGAIRLLMTVILTLIHFLLKLSAPFHKLTQVESNVEKVLPLSERVKRTENVIKSQQCRLKLLEYKSIDIESRSRRRNLIFRGISE